MSDPTTLQKTEGVAAFGIIDPGYGHVYTLARIIAWQEGYALTLHGSFTRDLDLVACPWTDSACEPEHLVKRIEEAAKLKSTGAASQRPHGRQTWTLVFPGFDDPRFVDLSVMPRPDHSLEAAKQQRDEAVKALEEARGYMLNAKIDLETSTKKAANDTLLRGLEASRATLASLTKAGSDQ